MNMRKTLWSSLIALTCVGSALADTVALKDGRTFEGSIVSQDKETLVLDMDGLEMRLPVSSIKSIDLSVAEKQAQTKSESVKKGPIELAPGTEFTIRMSQQVNSREHKSGHKFKAVLEANLMSGDVVVAEKGSDVYGVVTHVKKAGRLAGAAQLVLEITDISIDGTMHKVATQPLGGEGQNTARNTVGKTARAAAIGGLIDGSDGAKTGAKVGVGAAILTKGNDIQVPKDALLDFELRTPLKI